MSHKSRRLTVVAYAVNGSGLGHLTRVLALLRWMRRLARLAGVRLEAYVLTSSEAPGLALEEGFAAFKIPSKTAVRDAGLPKEDYLRLARQWVWHSLGLLKPDLLLVDTFPGGSFGELIQALDAARARVFIHRAMRDEFAQSEGVQSLLPFYDRILIPVEPSSPAQEVHPCVEDRVRRVGPIMLRSRDEARPRGEARRRLGLPDGKLGLWLTAGGGGDNSAERAIHELVGNLSTEADLHLVVGAGPLYRGAPLRGPNITWLTSFNAAEDFSGLDLAISAAGYNSFHELLHAGVPTAFFAQEKVADEQSRRVRAAADAGCALALGVGSPSGPCAADVLRAVAALRDKGLRRRLAESARDFIPHNDARGAAFEALSAVLPGDSLEEAFELGTTQFFLGLARSGADLHDAGGVLRRLAAAHDLDAGERREFVRRLLSESGVSGPVALQSFQALARCFPPAANESEAEELLEATLQLLRLASHHGDERGPLELLKVLSRSEHLSPRALSSALCDFLRALLGAGESVWRGKAILARHLAPGGDKSPDAALREAAAEVDSGAAAKANPGLMSGESYDSAFGD